MTDDDPAEAHLQQCLSEAESASGLYYAHGVREAIAGDRRAKFHELEPKWPMAGHKVLRSSNFVGRFARLFADFDASPELREVDMIKAMDVVRNMCDARLRARGASTEEALRFEWCS